MALPGIACCCCCCLCLVIELLVLVLELELVLVRVLVLLLPLRKPCISRTTATEECKHNRKTNCGKTARIQIVCDSVMRSSYGTAGRRQNSSSNCDNSNSSKSLVASRAVLWGYTGLLQLMSRTAATANAKRKLCWMAPIKAELGMCSARSNV